MIDRTVGTEDCLWGLCRASQGVGREVTGGGMRPLRQTENEDPGSPFPGCHDDGRMGRGWAWIRPWGTAQ